MVLVLGLWALCYCKGLALESPSLRLRWFRVKDRSWILGLWVAGLHGVH